MVHARQARPRRQDHPRRPSVHAHLRRRRHVPAHPHRQRRRVLRRPDQPRAAEQSLPRRVRAELHERVVHRQRWICVQRGPLLRVRPNQTHVQPRDLELRDGPGHRICAPRPHIAAPSVRVPAHEDALLPLYAGRRLEHHGDPGRRLWQGRGPRRPDGRAGQGDDDRVCRRPDPPHHRRPAHPLRRFASAPAGQHGTAWRRHERRARPRQHPGQHRPRHLVGAPPRLPEDSRAGSEESRRLRRPERRQEAGPQLVELLRPELQEIPDQHSQGLVRQRRDRCQ